MDNLGRNHLVVARNRGRKTRRKSTLCNNRSSPKLLAGNISNVGTVMLTPQRLKKVTKLRGPHSTPRSVEKHVDDVYAESRPLCIVTHL